MIQLQANAGTVEAWAGEERLAVHPRALRAGQQFTLPGQWKGLSHEGGRPLLESLAIQTVSLQVERRSLGSYEALAGGVG